MVRAAAILALACLSGCNQNPTTTTRELADVANANSRNALAQIAELSAEVERLEGLIKAQSRNNELTSASLDEARGNHDRLRETFNNNVDKANKRDEAQERDIDWLMRRNGVNR